jgi:hypothetical protein
MMRVVGLGAYAGVTVTRVMAERLASAIDPPQVVVQELKQTIVKVRRTATLVTAAFLPTFANFYLVWGAKGFNFYDVTYFWCVVWTVL